MRVGVLRALQRADDAQRRDHEREDQPVVVEAGRAEGRESLRIWGPILHVEAEVDEAHDDGDRERELRREDGVHLAHEAHLDRLFDGREVDGTMVGIFCRLPPPNWAVYFASGEEAGLSIDRHRLIAAARTGDVNLHGVGCCGLAAAAGHDDHGEDRDHPHRSQDHRQERPIHVCGERDGRRRCGLAGQCRVGERGGEQ